MLEVMISHEILEMFHVARLCFWCQFAEQMPPILNFAALTLNLGLDGVLEHWLNRLHDTEFYLHIVNLWLHAFNGLEFSSMAAWSCEKLPDIGMDVVQFSYAKTNLLLQSMAIRLCVAKCLIAVGI